MVRKNISIGVDTWNALAALGKFGQTFDDIIKILLKEHDELNSQEQKQQKQKGLLIPENSKLRQFMSRVADSLKKSEMFELSEEDFTRYLEQNKRIQIQEPNTEEAELKEFIKDYAKRRNATEEIIERVFKSDAEVMGISLSEFIQYLKLQVKIRKHSEDREREREQTREEREKMILEGKPDPNPRPQIQTEELRE
jgi:hypothetical protein